MFLMISQHEQPSSHPHHPHPAAISEALDYDTVFGILSKNSEFLLCFLAPPAGHLRRRFLLPERTA